MLWRCTVPSYYSTHSLHKFQSYPSSTQTEVVGWGEEREREKQTNEVTVAMVQAHDRL